MKYELPVLTDGTWSDFALETMLKAHAKIIKTCAERIDRDRAQVKRSQQYSKVIGQELERRRRENSITDRA